MTAIDRRQPAQVDRIGTLIGSVLQLIVSAHSQDTRLSSLGQAPIGRDHLIGFCIMPLEKTDDSVRLTPGLFGRGCHGPARA
ncbi:hypothetical protein P7L78_03060 (plasmid) [Tistrella bauzanensis]|uniref:hypothetical protein n=1 Tax=Tistrella TaxID=171436 RepID=UPI0031F6AF86